MHDKLVPQNWIAIMNVKDFVHTTVRTGGQNVRIF